MTKRLFSVLTEAQALEQHNASLWGSHCVWRNGKIQKGITYCGTRAACRQYAADLNAEYEAANQRRKELSR